MNTSETNTKLPRLLKKAAETARIIRKRVKKDGILPTRAMVTDAVEEVYGHVPGWTGAIMRDEKCLTELFRRRQGIDRRCATEPLYWLRNLTKTNDPHATTKGMAPLKPFPNHEYFDHLFYFFTRPNEYPRIWVTKSRDVMASCAVAGYATWFAMWHEGVQIIE